MLALAKRMLRRKDKESIVDAAYNRYAFHDTGLPRWFAEDERRFMRWVPCLVGSCLPTSAKWCASPQLELLCFRGASGGTRWINSVPCWYGTFCVVRGAVLTSRSGLRRGGGGTCCRCSVSRGRPVCWAVVECAKLWHCLLRL